MSEPLKKPAPAPDSYSPKELPEIMSMAQEMQAERSPVMVNENMVQESFAYIKLGKVRFIGVDAWPDEDWGVLWNRGGEFMPALDALAVEHGTDIADCCSMMHHNGHEVDTENHYIAGRFFKAGTPVPDGYDFYDVPTDHAVYAVYTTDQYDGSVGAAYYATRDRILADGVSIPYPKAYWHAEVYTDGRPHEGKYRFAYMFGIEGVKGDVR